jgi:hypothetical protein
MTNSSSIRLVGLAADNESYNVLLSFLFIKLDISIWAVYIICRFTVWYYTVFTCMMEGEAVQQTTLDAGLCLRGRDPSFEQNVPFVPRLSDSSTETWEGSWRLNRGLVRVMSPQSYRLHAISVGPERGQMMASRG